jgi:prophage tail gpP-like protein
MRDPLETIVVTVGGRRVSGFSDISISLSVNAAARTATMTISDFAGRFPLMPGEECTIEATGDLVLTGYVREIGPSHDEQSHKITVSIASRAIDAVEASIDHPSGFAEDKDLIEIAREFDTAGVGIAADESFPKEKARFVNTGESLFAHIDRLARSHGALIYDTPEGELRIAKKPRGRHAGILAIGDGGNIVSASATLSEQGRHDEVIVRGQSSRGFGETALRIEARAKDAGVGRKRARIIVHESETDSGKLKERAERAVKRSAGYSRKASIVVAGWRDAGGRIFEPHFLVGIHDPRIYVSQDMAIETVTLTQSIDAGGPGTRATLSLVDPAALNGEAGSGGTSGTAGQPGEASDPVWQAPEPSGVVGVDY